MTVRIDSRDLLKQVSRSFYLTLRILPGTVRHPISLAYLLARASDTIADTQVVPIERRREALVRFRESVRAAAGIRPAAPFDFGDLAAAREGTPAERELLARIGDLLGQVRELGPADRRSVAALLDTITRGQETDLVRFQAEPGRIAAFDRDEELDGYTYDVAGCVGEFWTEMCRAHILSGSSLDFESLAALGIRFGKGLQLVNILRDLPEDLRRGRCYIPAERLSSVNLAPADLLDPSAMQRFRPVYEMYLSMAEAHLEAGWRYTTVLPLKCLRVRLACAWPVLIGVKTLRRLRLGNVLIPGSRIRISRPEIRALIFKSVLLYPRPAAWQRLYDAARLNAPK